MFTVEKKIVQELPPPKYITLEYDFIVKVTTGDVVRLGGYVYQVCGADHVQCVGSLRSCTRVTLGRFDVVDKE